MAGPITRLVSAVMESLGDDSVKWGRGERVLSHQLGPRRVVWVWTGGALEAPDNPGPRLVDDYYYTPALKNLARVEAHVLAEDEEATERLWTNTINAVDRVLETASTPLSYDVLSETEESAHVYKSKFVIVQEFEWDLFFVRFRDQRRNIDGFEHVCTIDMTLPPWRKSP